MEFILDTGRLRTGYRFDPEISHRPLTPVWSARCEAASSTTVDAARKLITEDHTMATVMVDAWSTVGHLVGGVLSELSARPVINPT